MTLAAKQRLFTRLLGGLILRAYETGYELTVGDAYRSTEEAMRLAAKGAGIPKSLHCLRLAMDFNLFRNGEYLTKTEDWADLGAWWETQHELAVWGGRFHDGNHFSLKHDGRA